MSQESNTSIDDEPLKGVDLEGLRSLYNEKLSAAIEAAKKYDGTEEEQKRVLAETITFEEAVQNALGLPPGEALPPKVETKLKEVFAVEGEGTVEEILSLALDSFQKRLEEILNLLKLKVIRVDKVMLPPGEGTPPKGDEEEPTKRKRTFVERFKALIILLNKKGVFIDDIVLVEGKEPTEHVRTEGYRLIEIPRLQRQVLVCDEKGEATFVLLKPIDREYFFTHTKTDLKNSFPGIVKRFYHDSEWLQELEKNLFDENIVGEKIDLELREAIVTDLQKRFPTAKDWYTIGFHARRDLESCGHGLTAISTRIGGPVRPITKAPFLRLGLAVYGHQDEYLNHRIKLEEGDVEEWKLAIKNGYPTQAALLSENPSTFKAIEGFQFHAIMDRLGLPHTRGSFKRVDIVLLATHIFGATKDTLAAQEKLAEKQKGKETITDLAAAKKAFLEGYPSAQKWIDLESSDKQRLN